MPIEYDLPLFSYIEEKVPVCPEGYSESAGGLTYVNIRIDCNDHYAICRMCGEKLRYIDDSVEHYTNSTCYANYCQKYNLENKYGKHV
jgi:hypothetical protein